MEINRNKKVIIVTIIIFVMFNSCIMDYKCCYLIRNDTNDTLLIELSDCDTLNDSIYRFDENILLRLENTVGSDKQELKDIIQNNTVVANLHGEKVYFSIDFYALPGDATFANQMLFTLKDTCYIYAIKWQVAKQYPIEEIRARKLYDRRTVTKKDFHDRIFEYRVP